MQIGGVYQPVEPFSNVTCCAGQSAARAPHAATNGWRRDSDSCGGSGDGSHFQKLSRSPLGYGLPRSWLLPTASLTQAWKALSDLSTRGKDGDGHRCPSGICSTDDGGDGSLLPVRESLIAVHFMRVPFFVAVRGGNLFKQ